MLLVDAMELFFLGFMARGRGLTVISERLNASSFLEEAEVGVKSSCQTDRVTEITSKLSSVWSI